MRSLIGLLLFGFSIVFCRSILTDFIYTEPSPYLISKYLKQKVEVSAGSINAVDYLPLGFSKNGKIEYTQPLQNAIFKNKVIVFPDFPVLINGNGLTIPSDRVLIFQKNSLLIFAGPATSKFSDIIKVYNVKNVKIINPHIKGSKNLSITQKGEWSAGISILNSKDITIENPRIYDTYGDGITIGSEDDGYSENVHINNGWIDNARRNGISITSGKGLYINHVLISNTNGTLPECGIDIEPSWDKHILQNVNLTDVYTFNNKVGGISVNMNGLSVKNKSDAKFVSVNIIRHIDDGSAYGLITSLNTINGMHDAKGKINVIDSFWRNNKKDLYWKSQTEQSIVVTFKNIQIDNDTKKRNFESFLIKQKNYKVIE